MLNKKEENIHTKNLENSVSVASLGPQADFLQRNFIAYLGKNHWGPGILPSLPVWAFPKRFVAAHVLHVTIANSDVLTAWPLI